MDFAAYLLVAPPMGIFMRKYGYKLGIHIGLGLFSIGESFRALDCIDESDDRDANEYRRRPILACREIRSIWHVCCVYLYYRFGEYRVTPWHGWEPDTSL